MSLFDHPEILVEGVGLAIAGIIAHVRLEGKINADRDRIAENLKHIEKLETRIEKMETRHDVVYTEVRNLLSVIQRSISNIEGRLSINTKGD